MVGLEKAYPSTVVAVLLFAMPVYAQSERCDDLMPSGRAMVTDQRAVTASDLVRLRDIGPSDVSDPTDAFLAVSPDGRRIAFQMRRADPVSNSYCLAMFVMDATTARPPTIVDKGGVYIRGTYSTEGITNLPAGYGVTITPRWSPDGQWIAFLRRDTGATQLWRARTDGTLSEPVTSVPFDIEDFRWLDNETLLFVGRPRLEEALAQIEYEGRGGFAYDDRYVPQVSKVPLPREPIQRDAFKVRVATRVVSPEPIETFDASASDVARPLTSDGTVLAFRPDGGTVVSQRLFKDRMNAPTALVISEPDGRQVTCESELCSRVIQAWWIGKKPALYYLKWQAVKGRMGLYRWHPGKGSPQAVFETDDALIGCEASGDDLVCGREGSLQPRQVVRIDPKTGEQTLLFNPNPEFHDLTLGQAQRFRFQNDRGFDVISDLVLPPDHIAGQKHPLIVVGYTTRGFLRGGTGDEYPIQLFAQHGYAVLSFQRPSDFGYLAGARTALEAETLNRTGWADRKSVQSALETAVKLVVQTGAIDERRMGITGFSDGVSTVQYALLNSHLFSAAAISNCCEDVTSVGTLLGPAFGATMHELGYPALTQDAEPFWSSYSPRLNASRFDTPLLIQVPDAEFLYALESYSALKEQGKPVEMFVFPNEFHVKWQPAHRLAVYERSLAWFDRWLKGS